MDFLEVKQRQGKRGIVEVYPSFKVGYNQDLMIRGKAFYAIWDQDKGMWSTDEFDVARLVDDELRAYATKLNTEDCSVQTHIHSQKLTM